MKIFVNTLCIYSQDRDGILYTTSQKKISCSSRLHIDFLMKIGHGLQYVHLFITLVITTILYVDYLLMVVLPIDYHHNLEALHSFKRCFSSSDEFAGPNVGLPESALVLTPKTQIRFQDLTTCGSG